MNRSLISDFPLVADEERRIRAEFASKIGELNAAMQLCELIAALDGDQRFKLWISQLEVLHRHASHELLNASEPHGLARAQGKVQALSSILAITKAAAQERKDLAERLRSEHDYAVKTGITSQGPIHPSAGLWSKSHGQHDS